MEITRTSSTDKITVKDWYLSSLNQVVSISLNDGAQLVNTQVDQLIQAMATFSADNGGITWEQAILDRPTDVQAILAANWQ